MEHGRVKSRARALALRRYLFHSASSPSSRDSILSPNTFDHDFPSLNPNAVPNTSQLSRPNYGENESNRFIVDAE